MVSILPSFRNYIYIYICLPSFLHLRNRNDRILSPHTLCGLQLTQLRARFVLSTCRRFFRFWFVFCQSQLMEIKISKSNFIPVESDVIFNPVKDMVSILLCMVYISFIYIYIYILHISVPPFGVQIRISMLCSQSLTHIIQSWNDLLPPLH